MLFLCRSIPPRPLYSAARARQRGVALITVLMVFAIASLIAGKVIMGKAVDTQRVTGMVNRTQAYYYALAAESLAMLALRQDDQNDVDDQEMADDLEEMWASGAIPFEIDSIGSVVVQIIDLNRFYNINNMVQGDGQVNDQELERFRHLLVELQLDPELADNLKDWLDSDDREAGYLSESSAYLEQTPAYRAANSPMLDISELRLVNGFEPEVLQVLLPHITAVATVGVVPLNVNTATDYALTTLQESVVGGQSKGLTISAAQNIVSERPYDDDQDFNARSGTRNLLTSTAVNSATGQVGGATGTNQNYSRYTKRLGVTSLYYEINIRANYAGHMAYLTTVVWQEGIGANAKYVVLSRRETDNSARLAQFSLNSNQ